MCTTGLAAVKSAGLFKGGRKVLRMKDVQAVFRPELRIEWGCNLTEWRGTHHGSHEKMQ